MIELCYDFDGNPINYDRWVELFATAERHVACTGVGPGVQVSTVWLGLDHSFRFDGPPLIFETLIFGGTLDGEQWWWPNRDAALAGHDQIVAEVRDVEGVSVPETPQEA